MEKKTYMRAGHAERGFPTWTDTVAGQTLKTLGGEKSALRRGSQRPSNGGGADKGARLVLDPTPCEGRTTLIQRKTARRGPHGPKNGRPKSGEWDWRLDERLEGGGRGHSAREWEITGDTNEVPKTDAGQSPLLCTK